MQCGSAAEADRNGGVMAFFENLGATISSKGKDVAKKAKELAEVASLNGQISTQEDNINRAFTEMGKALYEKCKSEPDVCWEEQCGQIDACYEEITRLRGEILKVKGVKLCPQCNVEVPDGSAFCPSCGTKMPEEPVEEQPTQEAEEAADGPKPPVEVFETVEDPQVVETAEAARDEEKTDAAEQESDTAE